MSKTPEWTSAHAVTVEGSRIGIITCLKCGAAVVLDMQVDAMALHTSWHSRQRAGK